MSCRAASANRCTARVCSGVRSSSTSSTRTLIASLTGSRVSTRTTPSTETSAFSAISTRIDTVREYEIECRTCYARNGQVLARFRGFKLDQRAMLIPWTPVPASASSPCAASQTPTLAPRVRSDLATALGSEAPLVVDLTQATFIDSTIVGVLLEGSRELREARAAAAAAPAGRGGTRGAPPLRDHRPRCAAAGRPELGRGGEPRRRAPLAKPRRCRPGWTIPVS